ncbi:MAG: pentapeptide repeat-containing protein [Planctomycetota bacterium]|jgi:uncharacterized protein YjbI with pentapeptide repeats/MinD-like ATPase involved in chromosome partitioning or flagellar assembly
MSEPAKRETEIIAISSGKGGTGKTLIASCLGYALKRAGHKVLMLDADPGTDGLSLYMLGPDGMDTLSDIGPSSTFLGIFNNYGHSEKSNDNDDQFEPFAINRKHDHGIIYDALISGKGIYGDIHADGTEDVLTRLGKTNFQDAVEHLFETLRTQSIFDYVLVDTRGGFSFESTSICAFADSFVVVTEADYTNFYQDRNLVKRINEVTQERDRQTVLRGIIVNKATHGEEKVFRLAIEREFPIKFKDTYPVPLDLDAIEAYRHQQIPFVAAQGSEFAASSLKAFSRIMHLVTGRWEEDRIDKWNELVSEISSPYKKKYSFITLFKNRLKSNVISISILAVLAITLISYQYYQGSQHRKMEESLAAVFSTETSPLQRTNGLILLFEKGMKTFNGVDISSLDLSQTTLSSIQLQRGYLAQTKLIQTDMKNGNLRGANLTRANANEANLQGTDLVGAILKEANLQGADLTGANANEADFQAADIAGAILKGANLQDANLQEANLYGTDLTETNLNSANLRGANFQEANLESAQGLTIEQLSEVRTLYRAKLHSDLLIQIKKEYPHLITPNEEQMTKN